MKSTTWCVTLAAVCAPLAGASCAGSGHVTGTVTKLEDGALAGARITIDGLKRHEEVLADAMGRFDFSGVTPGPYTVKAELQGLVTETRKEVRVGRGGTATVDFVLHPACLEEGAYVDSGLRWALLAAQEIAYVRIGEASMPDRWIVNDQCIVGIDHTATVLSLVNMSQDSASVPKEIHLVKDGRMPFGLADEYIAFIRWEPAIGRYRPIAGPIFMIPVSDGKVVWNRTDAPGIRNGDPVAKVLPSLYALLPSARAAR